MKSLTRDSAPEAGGGLVGASPAGSPRSRPRVRRWRPLVVALALSVAAGGIGAVLVAHRQLAQRSSADGAGSSTASVAATGPTEAAFAPMAYDEASRSVVMFDGKDTWTWDGSAWQRRQTRTKPTTGGPGVTVTGRMAFDPQSRSLILYVQGFQPGCFDPGSDLGHPCGPYHDPETWSWDGTDWHRLAAQTPDGGLTLALDTTLARPLLLTGTANACGTVTWLWSGTSWTKSLATSPNLVMGDAEVLAVTDPLTDHVLLVEEANSAFNAKGASCMADSSTWEWDGSSWNRGAVGSPWPFPGQPFALGSDAGSHQVLAFTQNGDTWAWNGSAWSQLHPARSPSERIGPAMAYDTKHHRMILLGGMPANGCYQVVDTWTWSGSDWTQLRPGRPDCARH